MSIEYAEFYYLIGACVAYLAAILIYNAVGGKKKRAVSKDKDSKTV